MTDETTPRRNPHFDKPIHLLRKREREWTPREIIKMAQGMSLRTRLRKRPVTLPQPLKLKERA